jgi:hypothetical protein
VSRPHRGWPLGVHFAVLFVLFVALAGAAVVYVSIQTARDARAEAEHDARFSAQTAATQLAGGIATVRATVAGLAANPQIAQVLKKPEACTLTFSTTGGFNAGHVDVLTRDGRVACSSREASRGARYTGESWLRQASSGQVLLAPLRDRATGKQAVLSAAPFKVGQGYVAVFADLEPIGKSLASLYGGGRETEFLLTSGDSDGMVLTRSVEPGRWIGTSLASTAFGRAGESSAQT